MVSMVKTCDTQVQFHNPLDLSFEVGIIVGDDLLWYSKRANDVVLYESVHMLRF